MNPPLSANSGNPMLFAQASVAARSRVFQQLKRVGKSTVSQSLHFDTQTATTALQVVQEASITPESAAEFDRDARYKKPVHKPFPVICLDGDGYIRLNDVLTVYPVSRAAWYDGVLKGIYPAGVKLGPRSVGWSRAAIRELIANPPKF
ncbi:AlpA family transcriptional regulator [Comamonas sp.]|uniref:helix-turn-helix transcriptional regulator n=1 Tax=Comamonas sp. TaxID=34028 RepID=UPI0026498E62|nr:AlpA family phage regulatory protein [Comamonas sp.]MDN5535679.1 AlpA family phage regulatory protein [Comamonas sp.]